MVEINSKYIRSINYLISKKTQNIPHHNKSFFQHLLNVYNTLRKWNCPEDICFAGLFHSIYGNEIFKVQTEKNREVVKDIIGEQAEKIVFNFNQNRMLSNETKIISFANDLDHSFIKVFDDIYDQKDIDDIYLYFRDEAPWYFIGSGLHTSPWRKFHYSLKFENKLEKKLNEISLNILNTLGINELFKLDRAYASANPYGTIHESHIDSENYGDMTVMFYLNKNWSVDNAGETVFYCDNKIDIIKSITPKPARAVLFDGTISHCARDVTRNVNDLRIVTTFKYSFNLKNDC